jgi:Flp pilus assembly protein TadG
MKRRYDSSSGQTLVEFAFIFFLLMIVIMGIIEFSIIIYDKALITNASREGARAGVMYRVNLGTYEYAELNEAGVKQVVGDYLQDRLITFGAPFNPISDVQVSWSSTPPVSGAQIDVRVNFNYAFLTLNRLMGSGNSTMQLNSRTIMRME